MSRPCEDCRRSCEEPCWKVEHGVLMEVVRCQECKYKTKYSSCGHPRHEVLPAVYPRDFCSYGEKEERHE